MRVPSIILVAIGRPFVTQSDAWLSLYFVDCFVGLEGQPSNSVDKNCPRFADGRFKSDRNCHYRHSRSIAVARREKVWGKKREPGLSFRLSRLVPSPRYFATLDEV